MTPPEFTPALGRAGPTAAYDRTIRFWTREGRWRPMLVDQIDPQPGERILDVGCGTGSLAILLKSREPRCEVVGLDPDAEALDIARSKAIRLGLEIGFAQGFAREARDVCGTGFDKVVSSLLFHQVPPVEKRAGIKAMAAAARAAGEIHIADYAEQPDWFMRRLFGIVQRVDGYENTQANADGALTHLLEETFDGVIRATVVRTPTGAITLFRARARAGPA